MKMKLNFLKFTITIMILIFYLTNNCSCKLSLKTNELETLVELDQDNLEETQVIEKFLKKNENDDLYSFKSHHKKHKKNEDPSQEYDFYVFTVSWSDSFCRANSKPAHCFNVLHALNEKRIFRIHGLWPSRTDRKNLPDCNDGPKIQIHDSASEPYVTMSQIWPSLNYNSKTDFWTHEYNKHGYCYTKKYDIATYTPFFEKAVEMYNQYDIKNLMSKAYDTTPGQSYSLYYDEIKSTFKQAIGGSHFEIKCDYKNGEHFLDEIRLFLDLDFSPLEGFTYNSNCPKSGPINFYMEYDE